MRLKLFGFSLFWPQSLLFTDGGSKISTTRGDLMRISEEKRPSKCPAQQM